LQWFFGLFVTALLATMCPAQEQEGDEQYVEIYTLIQQADTLNASTNTARALTKYQQAQSALVEFRKAYPSWNEKTISFRLSYVADKIASCSGKVSPPGNATEPSTETKAPPSAGSVEVKLLEPGAEPRKQLRLHPNAGDKQTLLMTMKMGVDMKLGEQNQAMKFPAIKMTMDVTPKSVSPEGDIAYDMAMSDVAIEDEPGALPQVTEALKASLGSVKGLSGTGTMSSRGFNKGMDVKLPAGSDPQMTQAMQQMKESFSNMSAPLPEEPVGPGAKWEVKMPIKSQGMTLNQTTTYQLASVDGENLTLKSTVVQSAANQKIQNPTMPGLKMDLTKMDGQGTADLKFDLTKLLPSEATLNSHSDLSMAMNAGGQKQSMAMKLDLNLRLESK
jgi:hypothetical protein